MEERYVPKKTHDGIPVIEEGSYWEDDRLYNKDGVPYKDGFYLTTDYENAIIYEADFLGVSFHDEEALAREAEEVEKLTISVREI